MRAHLLFSKRIGFFLAVGAIVLHSSPVRAQSSNACADCAPGPHFVDNCSHLNETAIAMSGAVVGIDLTLNGQADLNLVLRPCDGPAGLLVMDRHQPGSSSAWFPALSCSPGGHNCIMQVEMVSMCLTNGSVTLRAGQSQGQGASLSQTRGAIHEDAANPALARSFFEVFFEVDLGGGNYAYNQTPLLVEEMITCVPPAGIYRHVITAPIPLFSAPVGGVHVANLVTADHIVNVTVPALSQWGMVVMLLLVLSAGTVVVMRRRAGMCET